MLPDDIFNGSGDYEDGLRSDFRLRRKRNATEKDLALISTKLYSILRLS
jgi:hypothetical protein